jgi:phosphatidylglycerophosphatase C
MGDERRSEPSGAPVAAFDLDGTLVAGHSMPRFILRVAGPVRGGCAVVHAVPPALWSRSRRELKQRVVAAALAGRPVDEVRRVGRQVADELVTDHLIEDSLLELEAHRAAGHQLVLVTAALDVYADQIGDALDLDAVIAAKVEVSDGICTGRVANADLRGATKVTELTAWLGDREPGAVVFAYGNSDDDRALVRYAAATRERASWQAPVVRGRHPGA